MGENIAKKGLAAGAAALLMGSILVNHERGSTNDADATQPAEHKVSSIYDQENAAANLIKAGKATGETAIVVVGPEQSNIGELVEDVAADGSGSQMAEQITNQNHGSTTIQEGQRFALPVSELDADKTNLQTVETPANVGYNAEGVLAPIGSPQEAQVVTVDVASEHNG
jgi:hypothetical protein